MEEKKNIKNPVVLLNNTIKYERKLREKLSRVSKTREELTNNMREYKKVYHSKKREKDRQLLQEQYVNKWRRYMTNTEYMLWCNNKKMNDPVSST
jgi:hypothetical protein